MVHVLTQIMKEVVIEWEQAKETGLTSILSPPLDSDQPRSSALDMAEWRPEPKCLLVTGCGQVIGAIFTKFTTTILSVLVNFCPSPTTMY